MDDNETTYKERRKRLVPHSKCDFRNISVALRDVTLCKGWDVFKAYSTWDVLHM